MESAPRSATSHLEYTANDIVQSLLDEVSDYRMARSAASGLPAIRKPFELNEVRRAATMSR
jgi:hypothetical protein